MRLVILIVLAAANFCASAQDIASVLAEPDSLPKHPLPMAMLTPTALEKSVPTMQMKTQLSMTAKQSVLMTVNDTQRIFDGRQKLPDIVFDWVQNQNGEIIPSIRHLVVTEHKHWDYILGVGKRWSTKSGKPSTLISMPITLVEKNENCSHNGVIVFNSALNDGQFYFQISSETCAYFKADFWAKGSAENTSIENASLAKQILQYEQEKQNRLPTKPIAALNALNKNVQIGNLALARSIPANDMTAYGLFYDGTHYVSPCMTRAGLYPFCEQLVLPSYSTAKSLFAGMVMFYLEREYGDVFSQAISIWVPQCSAKKWRNVTFAHLLDMSTGNFKSAEYSVDEASPKKLKFFTAKTHKDRLKFACNYYPNKAEAGQSFVYHSSDTYLLGAGLNAYIKSKLGPQADIFSDVLYAKIFQALALSQVTAESRRTSDASAQAYVGYGLFFTRDDLVRLSLFLSQEAEQKTEFGKLEQQRLYSALQLNPAKRGLPTAYPNIRYQHGFWAKNIAHDLPCKNDKWLPLMSGYGGISVALLNNSSLYYYISDGFQFDWSDAIIELDKLNELCTKA